MKCIDDLYRPARLGETFIYRYGHKAVERAQAYLEANENGYYSFPVDGGNYWKVGTKNGQYGEFMVYEGTCFSVNRGGFAYAKAGTEKGEKFVEFVNSIISEMHAMNDERIGKARAKYEDEEEEEEDE